MAHEGLHESEEKLYNNLFRRYPEGSDMLQIDYLKGMCTIVWIRDLGVGFTSRNERRK